MERDLAPVPGAARPPVRWPVPAVLITGFAMLTLGMITTPKLTLPERLPVLGGLVLLALAVAAAAHFRSRWWPAVERVLDEHTEAVDQLPDRHLGWWIALASGVGLFAELVLIRWHASTFQLFAYFKNVSLLAAFLGLGLGYARGRSGPLLTPLVIPAISLQFALFYLLRFSAVQDQLQSPISDNFAFGIGRVSNWLQAPVTYGFLILVFAVTVLTCLPLGQLASRLMTRRPPLAAYSCNLLGSLAGISLFALLGYLWAAPPVWLMLALAGLAPFLLLGRRKAPLVASLCGVGVALAVLAYPFRTNLIDVYSPYQILSVEMTRQPHANVQVNHVYYQRVFNLGPSAVAAEPGLRTFANVYEWAYRLKPAPGRVLVVGAGTGNDVAAGLRRAAGHIDAVEIDPAILQYGRLMHPEQPYQDARVEAIVEDARTFLRQTDRRYDLIVYGLLDSHTLLSGMSSVRLDSFVYTVEGFREARGRLSADGMISMTFCLLSKPMGRKFYLMLQEAFDGEGPRVFETQLGHIFAIGPGLPRAMPADGLKEVTAEFASDELRADVATDDWPFVYMPVRKVSFSCLLMVTVLLTASLLVVYQLLPLSAGSFSPACFFLGAGFMLLETKGITELGLLFGNTFQVISVVIAGILVMAFLANLLCQRVGTPPGAVSYVLLIGSVVLGLAVPATALAGLPGWAEKLAAAGLLTLPLFFSGLAFSGELGRSSNVPAALSCNLLGAMLGGFAEYNSMYFGFRGLSVLALVFYALAFAGAIWVARTAGRGRRAAPADAPRQQAA